jgi:hypothetical protein
MSKSMSVCALNTTRVAGFGKCSIDRLKDLFLTEGGTAVGGVRLRGRLRKRFFANAAIWTARPSVPSRTPELTDAVRPFARKAGGVEAAGTAAGRAGVGGKPGATRVAGFPDWAFAAALADCNEDDSVVDVDVGVGVVGFA